MRLRNQWPVLPIVAGLASGLLTGCGAKGGGFGGTGAQGGVGGSGEVLPPDPPSRYDLGSLPGVHQ